MNPREFFGVGASLLGIYILVQGIVTLPGVAAAYGVAPATGTFSPVVYALSVASESVLLVILGGLLFYRYRSNISSTGPSHFSISASLFVGASLLGIYFMVSGAVALIANVGQAMFVQSTWQFRFSQITTGVLYVIAGAALALRASSLADKLAPKEMPSN